MVMAIGMIIALLIPMIAAMAEETTAAPAPGRSDHRHRLEAGPGHGDQRRLCSHEYKEGEGFLHQHRYRIACHREQARHGTADRRASRSTRSSPVSSPGKYARRLRPDHDRSGPRPSTTDPYANAVQTVIVKEDSDIQSADDFYNLDAEGNPVNLKGPDGRCQTSTTGDIYISDTVENSGVGERDHRIQYKTGQTRSKALSTGKVKVVVIDNEPAKNFVKLYKGLKLLDTPYMEEEYAIAINKNNTELLQKVNVAISAESRWDHRQHHQQIHQLR